MFAFLKSTSGAKLPAMRGFRGGVVGGVGGGCGRAVGWCAEEQDTGEHRGVSRNTGARGCEVLAPESRLPGVRLARFAARRGRSSVAPGVAAPPAAQPRSLGCYDPARSCTRGWATTSATCGAGRGAAPAARGDDGCGPVRVLAPHRCDPPPRSFRRGVERGCGRLHHGAPAHAGPTGRARAVAAGVWEL